jgi:hypothetical protein
MSPNEPSGDKLEIDYEQGTRNAPRVLDCAVLFPIVASVSESHGEDTHINDKAGGKLIRVKGLSS